MKKTVQLLTLLPFLFGMLALPILAEDVAVYDIFVSDFLPPGDYPVKVWIYNDGSSNINDVKLSWRINGGNIQEEWIEEVNLSASSTPLIVPIVSTQTFTVDSEQTIHTLEVWVDEPDQTPDEDPSNNYVGHNITQLQQSTDTHILLETYMGNWCPYCPDGEATAQAILASHPNKVIHAALHQGDAMEVESLTDELDNVFDVGVPNAIINRHLFPPDYIGQSQDDLSYDRATWQERVEHLLDMYAPISLSCSNSFDSVSRNLSIDITATALADLNGDYRINCYLIEHPVVGAGSDYDQSNFYSYNENYPDHPYYDAPNPIVGYEHSRVVRAMLGGAWGINGVIPTSVNANQPHSTQFNYVVPNEFNINALSLIAIVQGYDENPLDRGIVNSLTCPIGASNALTIYDHSVPEFTLSFNGKVLLEGSYVGNGQMSANLQDLIPTQQTYTNAPYNHTGNESVLDIPSNMVDWVLLEARSGTPNENNIPSTTTIEVQAAILLSNGSIVNPNDQGGVVFRNLLAGQSYYFVVRHRNHLDVLSATAIIASESVVYDFTIATTQAYGIEQQKQSGDGYALMYAGDYNQDGVIQNTDFDLWKEAPAINQVFANTDGNLDGLVQLTDYDRWFTNKSKLGINEIRF